MSGRKVDVGGEGPILKFLTGQDESSCSFDHAKVWSPLLDYSIRTGDPVRCFHSWAPPSYVYLASN